MEEAERNWKVENGKVDRGKGKWKVGSGKSKREGGKGIGLKWKVEMATEKVRKWKEENYEARAYKWEAESHATWKIRMLPFVMRTHFTGIYCLRIRH